LPFPRSPFLTVEQTYCIYNLITRIRNGRVITHDTVELEKDRLVFLSPPSMPLAWLEHLKRQFQTILIRPKGSQRGGLKRFLGCRNLGQSRQRCGFFLSSTV
jgi:hypothetical protein